MAGKDLDIAWQSWLQENLQRGCDRAELTDILVKNGFSLQSIKQYMAPPDPGILRGVKLKPRTHANIELYERLYNLKIADNDPTLQLNVVESDRLQLFTIDNFLNELECSELCSIIEDQLRPSEVSVDNGDKYFRTSQTSDLANQNHPLIATIDKRIANTLGISLAYSEKIQAQKYELGNEFKTHTDYFEPGTEEFVKFAGQEGQRTWTFMVYLNATEAGGGTYFDAIDTVFYPQPGRAVIWNNLAADGRPNPNTSHHGMPVERGSKVIFTKWFRDKGEGSPFN